MITYNIYIIRYYRYVLPITVNVVFYVKINVGVLYTGGGNEMSLLSLYH